jgi:quercetin dioxygenase-like cupin family protein
MQIFTIEDYVATNSEGFTKRIIHQTPEGLVFALHFTPGQKLPPHTHEQSHLMVHVQSGRGNVTVNDKTQHVEAQTVIICEGHEKFSVENDGEDVLSLLCVLYPTPSDARYASNVR